MDAPRPILLAWEDEARGVRWRVELEPAVLLPGRLAAGRLKLMSNRGVEARAVLVNLIGVEHWRHRVTRRDANGTTHTEVVTAREEHRRVPVRVHGPLRLEAGQRWEASFELPVPPMGPASLDARDAGMTWTLEAKLDIDDGLDSRTEREVVVAQPTALLRAGAVRAGQFALFESADVAADGASGSIAVEPVPLVCGAPFEGRIELQLDGTVKLQEVRAEVRIEVAATVSAGEHETITAWSDVIAPAGSYGGEVSLPFGGALDPRPLPTIELPHGRASATFHVILAKAWAIDTHLERDLALATTRAI